MNEELKQRALAMYKAPFKYDKDTCSIFDANEMDVFIYGVFQVLEGELIAAALNEYFAAHKGDKP